MGKADFHSPVTELLRVNPGFSIEEFDKSSTPGWHGDHRDAVDLTTRHGKEMADLQERLFACGKKGDPRSVLVVLQGMDTAGKGGMVRHVLGMVDPQGLRIAGFGVPTPQEKAHDFLWRIRAALPPAGHIGVFDRSHYEDVLVARVHQLAPADEIERRYGAINDFEAQLSAAGVALVKVALLVSRDEQKRRLQDRLDRPDKHWKFSANDLLEREFWPFYNQAYQVMFDRTSTDIAPWYAVAADKKWYARIAVTELILAALRAMDLTWPVADFDVEAAKAQLASE